MTTDMLKQFTALYGGRALSRQRRWQLLKVLAGCCQQCGQPGAPVRRSGDRRVCEPCTLKRKAERRRRRSGRALPTSPRRQ